MQRSTLLTPTKKDAARNSSATSSKTKILKAPLDPNSKASRSNNQAPGRHVAQARSSNHAQQNLQAKIQRTIRHKQSYSNSKSTLASSQGSCYSSSHLNSETKNKPKIENSKAPLQRNICRQPSIILSSNTSKSPTGTLKKASANQIVLKGSQKVKPQYRNDVQKKITMPTKPKEKSNNFEPNKENASPNFFQNCTTPSTNQTAGFSATSKKSLYQQSAKQPNVPSSSSFKQSFAESENFCNIDEKDEQDVNIQSRKSQYPTLTQHIKEKYMRPTFCKYGTNSESFMRRNILDTSSNITCSSNSSFKSSFLVKGQKSSSIYQSSFYSRANVDEEIGQLCLNSQDEQEANQQKAGNVNDKLGQENIAPKTIFNGIVVSMNKRQSYYRERKSQLSDYGDVTSEPSMRTFQRSIDNINDLNASEKAPQEEKEEHCGEEEEEEPEDCRVNTESIQEDIFEFLQSDSHKMHLIQTLQSLQYVKNNLQPASREQLLQKQVMLPPFRRPWISKTLIFDLDETLVHLEEDFYNNNVDHIVNVNLPNGLSTMVGINVRPFALECLRRAAQVFQLVVFTASHQDYADVVIDLLDPYNELFEHRLYRDSCVITSDGVYIKDLRIFENCRRMEDLVIVDNAVYSFGYQLENGIPIIPFYHDKEDEELIHLTQYLECLVRNGSDIREHNRKAFQLRELQDLDVQQFLSNMMYDNSTRKQLNPAKQQSTSANSNSRQPSQRPQRQSSTQWEVLNLDSEVIKEESNEEDDSSMQDSAYNRKRRQRRFDSLLNLEDQVHEEDDERSDQLITNMSILEKDI